MIEQVLFYSISGLVIFSYLLYLLIILFGRSKKISDDINGFDGVKDIIQEYERINIIEGNNNFTSYNIKRKVIKLAKNDYYGYDVSALSLGMIQAGISVNDNNKNKFINGCRKIIPSLRLLDLLGLISLIINYISVTINDAKIGIVILVIVMIIHYLYFGILCSSLEFIDKNIKKIKNIKKDSKEKIINFINRYMLCHKIQVMAEVIIVIRFVMIILEM